MNKGLILVPFLAASVWACSEERDLLPAPYRDVAVPEQRLTSSGARQRGRVLYLKHCVLCHGEHADGQGVRQTALSTRPRDYSDPAWRTQASPRSVYYTLREGVQGTAMPAWNVLSEDETWDLVAYVLGVAEEGP